MENKWLRFIGNFIVVISLIFIIKKFIEFDIDYSKIFSVVNIIQLISISLCYAIISILQSYSWKSIIILLTNRGISWMDILITFTKAGLMKYLPGNIFHFIGRNELAIKCKISHLQVATSTMLDTLISFGASIFLAIFFYYKGLKKIINTYKIDYSLIVLGFSLLIAICVVLYLLREKMRTYLISLRQVASFKGVLILFQCFVRYSVLGCFTSLLYIWILVGIVKIPFHFPVEIVLGAVSLSSVIGFVTPGAPGGIGIREAVLSVLLTGYLDIAGALSAIVLFRLISILGDIWAYLIIKTFGYLKIIKKGKV